MPEAVRALADAALTAQRLTKDGTWDRLLRPAQARADAQGDLDWLTARSSLVRAHQHVAGARPVRGSVKSHDSAGLAAPRCDRPLPRRADDKIHLLTDGQRRPLVAVSHHIQQSPGGGVD